MGKALDERDAAKASSRRMMGYITKARKVMDGQEEEIKSLKKSRNPQLLKEMIEMAARAKAGHGMNDISSFMKNLKDI